MLKGLQFSALISSCLYVSIGSACAGESEIFKEVTYFEQTSDGKLSVCGSNYTIVFEDDVNIKAIDGLNMTIASFAEPSKFWTIVKLGFGSFNSKNLQDRTPLPIANVSLRVNNQTYQVQRTQCQDPSYAFCGGFAGDTAGYVASYLQFPNAELIFNQQKGTLDYDLDITSEPQVTQDMSKYQAELKESGKHSQCLVSLLQASAQK